MCLSIMLSKKDIRCLKADIDMGTTKCVGLMLVKATDVSRWMITKKFTYDL